VREAAVGEERQRIMTDMQTGQVLFAG